MRPRLCWVSSLQDSLSLAGLDQSSGNLMASKGPPHMISPACGEAVLEFSTAAGCLSTTTGPGECGLTGLSLFLAACCLRFVRGSGKRLETCGATQGPAEP